MSLITETTSVANAAQLAPAQSQAPAQAESNSSVSIFDESGNFTTDFFAEVLGESYQEYLGEDGNLDKELEQFEKVMTELDEESKQKLLDNCETPEDKELLSEYFDSLKSSDE